MVPLNQRCETKFAEFVSYFTWCPEQIDPFGIRPRYGLWIGHDVRGPHLVGNELKLLEPYGLHKAGGTKGITDPVAELWKVAGIAETPGPVICGHIVSEQFVICHWLPVWLVRCTAPLPQNGSVAKLSWLPEHCSLWGRGGDDCLDWIVVVF